MFVKTFFKISIASYWALSFHTITYAQSSEGCWSWSESETQEQKIATIERRISQASLDYIGLKLSPQLVTSGKLSIVPDVTEEVYEIGVLPPSSAPLPSNEHSFSNYSPSFENIHVDISDIQLLTNEKRTETILDLRKFKDDLDPNTTYKVVTKLPEKPRRKYGVFGERSFIPQKEKIGRKFISRGEYDQTGNTELGPYSNSSVLQRQSSAIQGATLLGNSGSGNSSSTRMKVDDALVQILIRSSKAQNIWGKCVGTHIGNGNIVTARHCLNKVYDKDDYIFLFGDIEEVELGVTLTSRPDNLRVRGQFECSASLTPSDLNSSLTTEKDPDGNYLDVAFLKTHSEFLTHSKAEPFHKSALQFGTYDNAANSIQTIQGPRYFSMATIWPDKTPHNFAFDEQNTSSQPEVNSKVSFFPNFNENKTYNCQNKYYQQALQLCSPNSPTKNQSSQYGWQMGCPTIHGTSGSPIFEAVENNNAQTRVIGIASSEGKTNCAAPIWLKTD